MSSAAMGQTALELYDQALGTIRTRRAMLEKMQYRAVWKVQQTDEDGNTTGKREQVFLIFPEGWPSSRLLSETKTGHLSWLEEKEKADKEKETATTSGDSGKKDGGKAVSQKPKKSVDDDPETIGEAADRYNLRDRYLWTRRADEKCAGRMARVITFASKPKYPAKSAEERFCNLLAGTLWLSPIDGTILKADVKMTGTHRLFWVIATLRRMDFSYKIRGRDGPGPFDASDSKLNMEIVLPFYHVRQEHRLGVDQFAPRGK